jgi:hypothetical protein
MSLCGQGVQAHGAGRESQGERKITRLFAQTFFEVFAEDILWHVPGRGPLSRDYRGHAEVLGFFRHFMELSHGTFRIQVDDMLAKGDRVVVLCTESAQRGGRSLAADPLGDSQGSFAGRFEER